MPMAPVEASIMASIEDIRTVQSRLQDLFETMPPAQAELLEAVVAGTPVEISQGASRTGGAEDASIIVVGGLGGRVLVFDLDAVLAELNPQPLPPGPPDAARRA